jgi:hypothetical protein
MTGAVPGEEFFAGDATAVAIYRALARALLPLEGVSVAVSKSQVAFRARRGFAYAWNPGRYVRSDVPVVVSIALRKRQESARFKEIAHPAPTTWMHHVELRDEQDVDGELVAWLIRAHEEAR